MVLPQLPFLRVGPLAPTLGIMWRVSEQVEKYMPFLAVQDLYVGPMHGQNMSENQLNISISYEIIPTSDEDILTLSLAEKQIDF